ncbi:MAG: YetF domain-containing protein [Actinomycetota bacterium]
MEIVVRATVIFFFLWGLTRLMGKRELAQMSAFELMLLVTIGDLVQQGVTQEDMSLTGNMLAVGTIGVWILALSYVGYRWKAARPAVEGLAVIVVRDGRMIDEALKIERLTDEEVLAEAREQGIEDLATVRLGILEADGQFTFLKADGEGEDPGPPPNTETRVS